MPPGDTTEDENIVLVLVVVLVLGFVWEGQAEPEDEYEYDDEDDFQKENSYESPILSEINDGRGSPIPEAGCRQ